MDIRVAETTFSTWMLKCRWQCGQMWWYRKDQHDEHVQLRDAHEETCSHRPRSH
jgi:hypothetical protein